MPMFASRAAGSARAFGLAGGVQGGGGGATIEFVDYTIENGGSEGIDIPLSCDVGDLAIMFDMCGTGGATAPSDVAPSGWTLIGTSLSVNGTSSKIRSSVRYRVLTAPDLGESVDGMAGLAHTDKIMLAFRKSAGTWQVPAGNTQQAPTVDPTLQTVTVGSAPLIVIGDYNGCNGFNINPRTFTPSADAEVTTGSNLHFVKYKIYNTAPQNTSVDMDDENAQILRSFYVSVA